MEVLSYLITNTRNQRVPNGMKKKNTAQEAVDTVVGGYK
jgi:hypothetical protein